MQLRSMASLQGKKPGWQEIRWWCLKVNFNRFVLRDSRLEVLPQVPAQTSAPFSSL